MPSRLGFAQQHRLRLHPLGVFEIVEAAEELLDALDLVADHPVAVGGMTQLIPGTPDRGVPSL